MGNEGRDTMNNYLVHTYAVVRLPVQPVRAATQKDAVAQVSYESAHCYLEDLLPVPGSIQNAEEIVGFLVDEVGDEQFNNSRTYDVVNGEPVPMGTAVDLIKELIEVCKTTQEDAALGYSGEWDGSKQGFMDTYDNIQSTLDQVSEAGLGSLVGEQVYMGE